MKKLNGINIILANIVSPTHNTGNHVKEDYNKCIANIINSNTSTEEKKELINLAYKESNKILKYEIRANLANEKRKTKIWINVLADSYFSIYEINEKVLRIM